MTLKKRERLLLLVSIAILILLGVVCTIYFQPQNIDNFDPTISDKKRIGIYQNIIDALEMPNDIPNRYKRRPETQHIDCGRVLKKDKGYIQSLSGNNRIPLIENRLLNMSCTAIKNRIHANNRRFKSLKTGGVAFARIVYSDYEFTEKQVEISWHPQNVFCFVIDKKSPRSFQTKMQKLGECVENIVVLPVTEEYDSSGHNMNLGHKRCMEALLRFPVWNYLIHLQNYDVITKSIYQISRIFEIFGGANDVNIGREIDQRRVSGLKWDPKSTKLFRNESKIDEKTLNNPMYVVSGSVQSSWSRAAVTWLIEEVDLTIVMNQFNQTLYAGDEQLFPSLQINKEYGMPGHYTHECMGRDAGYEQVTRFAKWASGNINNCVTKTVRHGVCLVGIEELRAISRMPAIISNKMIPSFDYSIIECTAELLFNRTFLSQVDCELDEKYYETMPGVLYHKHHNDPGFKLNCSPSHDTWIYEDYL